MPVLPPSSIPSRRASSRATWNDSASLTRTQSSTYSAENVFGTKSSPMPSTFHGFGDPPDSTDPSGSAPTTLTFGFISLRYLPTPLTVPPVPTPHTNTVTLPRVCSQISGPVVR